MIRQELPPEECCGANPIVFSGPMPGQGASDIADKVDGAKCDNNGQSFYFLLSLGVLSVCLRTCSGRCHCDVIFLINSVYTLN